jgi:hypothetical protein
MDHLSTLFGKHQQQPKSRRHTERGDLFDTILSHLNPPRAKKGLPPLTYQRLGFLLAGIPTKDLYALIAKCTDAQRRGFPWSAIFWKEIRPQQPNA